MVPMLPPTGLFRIEILNTSFRGEMTMV